MSIEKRGMRSMRSQYASFISIDRGVWKMRRVIQSNRETLYFGRGHASTLLGAALLGLFLMPQAHAQDDEAANSDFLDEIVVTGFRSSIEQSLAVKRDSTGVVDVIVAEDISDFPDLNLAESIQRIPGISITRVNGEGRQITVRGLGGDFNRIRINGMEAMSTSGGSDASGGSNRSRAFDFNTFASELFQSITVRKTASAEVEEGSIGATVELRTGRAFDYDEPMTIALQAGGGYNDQSENFNPRFVGLFSAKNEAETFGGLVSFAYSDRSIVEEGFSTVRWQDGTFRSVNGVSCVDNPTDAGCVATDTNSLTYHPRIPRYGRLSHEQDRLGLTGSLQFRPTDRTEISVDALYSNLSATRDEEFLEVFLRGQEGRIDVTSFTLDPSRNIIDSGTFNIDPIGNGTHPVRSEHRFDDLETEFQQITVSLDHQFTDRLSGNLLVGTTESTQDVPVQTTILFDAIDPVIGYSYDFRDNPNEPTINFGSLDVTDPSQFAFTEFRDRPQAVENSFQLVTANLVFDVSETMALKGGASLKTFEFDSFEARRESTNGSRLCDSGVFDCDLDDDGTRDIPGAPLTPDLYSFVTGGPGSQSSWITPNIAAAAALIDLYSIPGAIRSGNVRNVEEEDLGFWGQLDWDTTVAGMPLRGNVGVRWVETTVSSTGLVDGNAVTIERDYTDTLPSLNLALDVTESVVVRLGLAEVMARPSLGNLTPGGALDSFNGPPYAYNAGNPGLNPYRATNTDLSFEWYFAEGALVSLAYFDKDIDSFFFRTTPTEVPFSQSGLPDSLPPASSPLQSDLAAGLDPLVEITQIQNGDSATVDGFELIYQQPFSFLPGALSNLGFTGNFTRVSSDRINGFSENAYNATLWYDDGRFTARLSLADRDGFQTRDPRDNGRDARGFAGTTNLDFSASYVVNDTLELTFEAINLSDEEEFQVFDQADLVNVFHNFGTEYIIGVRWRPTLGN